MRILLLGEYSGYYANLARGFKKLGHDVTFFNSGHAWMSLNDGIPYPKYGNGIKGKLNSKLMHSRDKKKFTGFDLVFVIASEFVNKPWTPWYWDHIRSNNKKVIYTSCGQRDSHVLRYTPKHRVSFFKEADGTINVEAVSEMSRGAFQFCDRMVQECDGIITISAAYDIPYQSIDKPRKCIPLPIDTEGVQFIGIPNGKLEFLHGKQRRPFQKGSHAILSAFDAIQPKPILHHVGGLSLEKYLSLMASVHVIVDQCKGYGCGMNALFALAMGKIVMGGNEPENSECLNLPPSPVINLPFDSDRIRNAIIQLMEHDRPHEIGDEGRQYVEDHHKATLVAERYLAFSSSL